MWLVGSKLTRSNVTFKTTSFSRLFFPINDVMCPALWRHLSPTPHQFSMFEDGGGGVTALILRKSRKSCHLRVLQPAWASRVNLSSPKRELETVNLMFTSLKTPKNSRKIFSLVVGRQFRNSSYPNANFRILESRILPWTSKVAFWRRRPDLADVNTCAVHSH